VSLFSCGEQCPKDGQKIVYELTEDGALGPPRCVFCDPEIGQKVQARLRKPCTDRPVADVLARLALSRQADLFGGAQ